MLPVMLRTDSSMTSAMAFMMPSACARFRPSRSRRCTKWCVSKWKSGRRALAANARVYAFVSVKSGRRVAENIEDRENKR
jgi:hypothetical protein